MNKICYKCLFNKKLKDFCSGGNNRKRNICKKCHTKYNKLHRLKNIKIYTKKAKIRFKKLQKLRKTNKLPLDKQITYWSNQNACRLGRKRLDLIYLKQLCYKGLKLYPYMNFNSSKKKGYLASIDRINPKKGYVKGNLRIIPLWLNSAKIDLTIKELNSLIKHYIQR